MWTELGTAVALIFVIEGIIPFLNPKGWRQTLKKVSEMEDDVLRMIGLISMICGVILLYIVH